MDAIIFDFDGVIVDSEPTHMRCFQAVLATAGIELTREAYYSKYLGYDDHDCFAAVLRDHGRPVVETAIADMTARKTRLVQKEFAESIQPLPGAVELVKAAGAAGVAVAICSGALRDEILLAARTVGALPHVLTVVAAQDVRRGKPDPEGYLLALARLREITGKNLSAARTVVVEDSPAGLSAARAAGMKTLAVMTSYPADELTPADRVVMRLSDIDLYEVCKILD